ncbi:MAG: hypothetical protein L6R42_010498 [Xanthoria sp. 1 TBL-2021]|nr:MAG: hypothetical protein L6R42_010498 [Xanthoria sp. 1 TBL-2021]
MILIKDHTNIVAKSLAPIKFPVMGLKPRTVTKQKKDAVMFVTLGSKRRLPSYCLIKFELVDVLAKWMYSDLAIGKTTVQLEMLPEATHDPDMQKRVIAAFEQLRGMQTVNLFGFIPKTAGTALRKAMKAPLRNMTQGFQRIEAFRFRIALEMSAWQHKCQGDMEVHKRLNTSLKAAFRCMDQYLADLEDSDDWDGEHFIDRYTFLLTEQVYTRFVCSGAEQQDLTYARKCMLELEHDGPPVVALAMLYMRLCDIDVRCKEWDRAAMYIAKVETLNPGDKDVERLKRKVGRLTAEANANQTRVDRSRGEA